MGCQRRSWGTRRHLKGSQGGSEGFLGVSGLLRGGLWDVSGVTPNEREHVSEADLLIGLTVAFLSWSSSFNYELRISDIRVNG